MSRSRNLGYGEGSIYQEGDTGRWRGELRIGVKRRRVSAWTRREVVERLDELRSLNAAGLMMGNNIRVGEWFDWYDGVVISTKNKSNAASYRWALKHCEPLRGHRLTELEVEHVEDLFRELARVKPQLAKTKGRGGQNCTGLSKSTKPVRDALDKLEKSRGLAVAKLTGAVGQVEGQRQQASENAKKKGLTESDLTFPKVIELADEVIDRLTDLAQKTDASIKELSKPEDIEFIDSYSRRITEAIKVIRQTATNAAMATNTAKDIADVDTILTSLRRLSGLVEGDDEGLKEIQAQFGDLDTLDEQRATTQTAVQTFVEAQERLGTSERIVQDTLSYLRSAEDVSNCPACGQGIERDSLIVRLDGHLTGEIRDELEAARSAQRQHQQQIAVLDEAIAKRGRLLKDKQLHLDESVETLHAGRALLGPEVTDVELSSALVARKESLFDKASTVDTERNAREEQIEFIQSTMERLREIGRFLELDSRYQESSSRLGSPDEDSSVADQQIDSLTRLESGIRTIADVVTAEASTRARDAVENAQVDIARLYKELCDHPYFDDIQISVESQLLSGIERNNYFIRTIASSDNRQTLASSRLSTAQMNCVALSVYLALATQLQHNLGFVILDDPSQNLDTKHKQALVKILSELAPNLQVLIGTQDSELDELIALGSSEDSYHRRRLSWSAQAGTSIVAEGE